MIWLGLLRLLLSLTTALADYLRQKQLLDAGAAQETISNLRRAWDALARARAAVGAVVDDPGVVRDDPDNRDKAGKTAGD